MYGNITLSILKKINIQYRNNYVCLDFWRYRPTFYFLFVFSCLLSYLGPVFGAHARNTIFFSLNDAERGLSKRDAPSP